MKAARTARPFDLAQGRPELVEGLEIGAGHWGPASDRAGVRGGAPESR